MVFIENIYLKDEKDKYAIENHKLKVEKDMVIRDHQTF